LKTTLFPGFYELWPERFINKTNGVTPRRWLSQCNKPLAAVLTKTLGSDEWLTKLSNCTRLRKFADDKYIQGEFWRCKQAAKVELKRILLRECKIEVDTNALFDIHVKRIHEYKRQLLNILGIMSRYLSAKAMTAEQRRFKGVVPRVCVFGGKAAPSYVAAKNIIRLICAVAEVINNDETIGRLLKVAFIPNYNVSLAEIIIPASDISQHISTAGTEASGTSNMKFAMNGGLILGTLDGATVEIKEEIGDDNMFLFGLQAEEIAAARRTSCEIDPRLQIVLKSIKENKWASEEKTTKHFLPLINQIEKGTDYYLVARDFGSYLDCQERIDLTWKDPGQWRRMCINTTAGMGKFSSDRTVAEYANEIWNVKPCRVPASVE